MKKYNVPFSVVCTLYVQVEAEDVEDAIEKAYDKCYIGSYVWNWGNNKLIWVDDEDVSIEAWETFDVMEDIISEIE